MKKFSILILFMVLLGGCRHEEEELFIADKIPLNVEDSLAIMDLYDALKLNINLTEPWTLRHPDLWKGVSFDYDEASGKRFISGIDIYVKENLADSIPPSIGNLSHLRYLRIEGLNCSKNFTIPKEIFNCPLVALKLSNKPLLKVSHKGFWDDYNDIKGISGKIPDEIYNVRNTLKVLEITHTNITQLSVRIPELQNLEVCRLDYNKLNGCVPPDLRLLNCRADVSFNYYDSYQWQTLELGGNMPIITCNYISNFVPDEILEKYFDIIRAEIYPQCNSHLMNYLEYWDWNRKHGSNGS